MNVAISTVVLVLADALPPGFPPSYQCIVSAEYIRRGKHAVINADLIMFDGLSATVQIAKWNHGWSHQWIKLEGDPIWWNGKQWERQKVPVK